jgi:hypothetical protein
MMSIDHIAKICYETNRAYREVIGEAPSPRWEDTPDWRRAAIIDGVIFLLENPGVSAERTHENWVQRKEKDGWKYGVRSNDEKKEHPSICAYSMLTENERRKDALFIAVIHACVPQSFRPSSSIEIPVIQEM